MLPGICRLVPRLLLVACVVLAGRAEAQFCPGEQNRARAIAARVNEEWPQRPSSDEVSRYVQTLGDRLALATTGGAGIPWRFSTIRDRAPFAFAIGYGYIYVTDGTLRFANNESALAAVLAHEMGHQLAGHFCREPGDADGMFSQGNHREAPVGSLSQVIDLGKEQEADRLAVGIIRAAGLDPWAMYWVAEHLPQSTRYGHGQGNNRRLQALQETLHRLKPDRLVEPKAEAFRRAKESVEAEP